MELLITLFFFIYGLVFGSFFNVVGLRIPQGESIANPPSHCTNCNRKLRLLDLIPVFSYIFLRGKCRSCGTEISVVYPLMEFATGILFALAYSMIGIQAELLIGLLFISLLVIITVSDIAYMLIPNKILLPFAIVLLGLRLFIPLTAWWDSLLGAFVGFAVLYGIALLSKGGMGGGDVKLFFVIGLVLGTVQTLLTLFLSSFIGLVIGAIVLVKSGKSRKTPIPFGPSIAIAAIVVYFWGTQIVEWYGSLFV